MEIHLVCSLSLLVGTCEMFLVCPRSLISPCFRPHYILINIYPLHALVAHPSPSLIFCLPLCPVPYLRQMFMRPYVVAADWPDFRFAKGGNGRRAARHVRRAAQERNALALCFDFTSRANVTPPQPIPSSPFPSSPAPSSRYCLRVHHRTRPPSSKASLHKAVRPVQPSNQHFKTRLEGLAKKVV